MTSLHVPLPELPARYNRRLGKAIKQSPWLTLNDRDHWSRRKKLTAYFREKAYTLASEAGLESMGKIHVTAYVSYGSNRILDPHNYMLTAKAIIDGLVDYGLIADDNSKYLIGPDMRRDESLPVGLTVIIEESL